MELPIQLKSFRKLELYQELLFEDEKRDDSSTRLQAWIIEKKILAWTRKNHHHLGSTLDAKRINLDILGGEYSHEHEHAMYNLIQRGYAQGDPKTTGIIITKDGLLMGEVICELESRFGYLRYKIFHWIVWVTVLAGVVIVIANALKIIW